MAEVMTDTLTLPGQQKDALPQAPVLEPELDGTGAAIPSDEPTEVIDRPEPNTSVGDELMPPQDNTAAPDVTGDRSVDFIEHRERLSGGRDLEDMMDRVRSRQSGSEKKDATEKQEEEMRGVVEVRPLREGGFGVWVNGVLQGAGDTREDANTIGQELIRPRTGMETAVETVSETAADVGLGVIETPRQVVGGASDAVQETTRAIDDLADWLNENVADLRFSVDIPGVEDTESVNINPTELIRSILPDISEAKSTTGRAVRSIAQFITGFWGAGKMLRGLGVAAPATVPGRAVEAVGRGMAADFTVFNPSEQRLSNIIQDVPALQNPVTEYLAADPDDTEVEGRIKNALEGAGLGAFTEGFLVSLRGLRGVRKAETESIVAQQRLQFGELTDRDFLSIGEPDSKEFILRRPTTTGKLKEGDDLAVDPARLEGEGGVFINWARIDAPEDIKSAMQAVADMNKQGIDISRRGVRTNVETAEAAAEIDAWDVLLSRRAGQPLNAEESLALRQLWTSSTEALTQAAKQAAANPGDANLFAFRKMVAVQDAIQKEVIAARTETARALQSWSIPAGSGVERARAVQEILTRNADDPNVHKELARRIAVLGEAGEFDKMNEVARRSATARTYDAVVQAWINGLLSGPKTHMVNMISNTAVIGLTMAERGTAARLANLMGDDAAVQMGESAAQWFGAVQGVKDALRLSSNAERLGTVWKSIKTGQSQFGAQKIDQPRQGALASEVWNVSSDTGLGRALDALNVVTQLPGRALGAEDELFKTIGYRMEVYAQSMRQARSEVSAGKVPESEYKARIAELIENPPENIRLSAMDAAIYQTFNNPAGKISQTIMKYRDAVPVLGPLTAPFVRTVGNIMKFTFERTPIAPLMSQVRADISAGGARRDMALARMALGSSILAVSADLALNGQITGKGPTDPRVRAAERRMGRQPYSVKVGDRWFAYNRFDPIGTLVGISADMVDIIANNDANDERAQEDIERAVIATIAAVGANMMDKTYLTGFSDFIEALSDPVRNSEYWAQGVVGSFMPTAVAEVRRQDDLYMRETRTLWQSIMNRTPGLSEDLPLRRDIWGRPLEYKSGLGVAFDALSPIYSRQENPEPIDTELLRLGNGPSNMPRRTSFSGAVVNLDQFEGAYSRLVELAGNELKLPKYGNKGAKDALNDIVTGKSPFSAVYNLRADGPDGGKMDFIRSVVAEYRSAAKNQLVREFPEINIDIRRKLDAQQKWSVQ